MASNTKAIPTSEFDAVHEAAGKYVEGLRTGSVEVASQAYHKDAIMYGFISPPSGDLLGGSINNLWGFINQTGSAPELKTRIDILAITPTTAVVRVDMEKDATGADYTDFLTFVKIEGQWQAIAKAFHKYG